MTNAEARFNIALRPRKPESSLGRTATSTLTQHLNYDATMMVKKPINSSLPTECTRGGWRGWGQNTHTEKRSFLFVVVVSLFWVCEELIDI